MHQSNSLQTKYYPSGQRTNLRTFNLRSTRVFARQTWLWWKYLKAYFVIIYQRGTAALFSNQHRMFDVTNVSRQASGRVHMSENSSSHSCCLTPKPVLESHHIPIPQSQTRRTWLLLKVTTRWPEVPPLSRLQSPISLWNTDEMIC